MTLHISKNVFFFCWMYPFQISNMCQVTAYILAPITMGGVEDMIIQTSSLKSEIVSFVSAGHRFLRAPSRNCWGSLKKVSPLPFQIPAEHGFISYCLQCRHSFRWHFPQLSCGKGLKTAPYVEFGSYSLVFRQCRHLFRQYYPLLPLLWQGPEEW